MRLNIVLLSVMTTLAITNCDRQAISDHRDEPVSTSAVAGSTGLRPMKKTGIRGQIRTRGGLPVSNAMVLVECITEPCKPIPDIGVMSNASGFFFWPLPPGRYRLTVTKDNLVSHPQVIVVEPMKNPQVTVTLSASPIGSEPDAMEE